MQVRVKLSLGSAVPTYDYPAWVVLHIPHDSTEIPAEIRDQFVLSDEELGLEILRMTDHRTFALFAGAADVAVVRAPVSRLVVDVERFADDSQEPMVARGMGTIYMATSHLKTLRRQLSARERESLLERYYWPHHAALEVAVAKSLEATGHCLVIDCHSFPGQRLPYEMADAGERPDICIGTDGFHTPTGVTEAFVTAFESEGWVVAVNTPFAGTIVPASRYQTDRRVSSVMVEVNRALYLNEADGTPRGGDFNEVAAAVQRCCREAVGRAFNLGR